MVVVMTIQIQMNEIIVNGKNLNLETRRKCTACQETTFDLISSIQSVRLNQ